MATSTSQRSIHEQPHTSRYFSTATNSQLPETPSQKTSFIRASSLNHKSMVDACVLTHKIRPEDASEVAAPRQKEKSLAEKTFTSEEHIVDSDDTDTQVRGDIAIPRTGTQDEGAPETATGFLACRHSEQQPGSKTENTTVPTTINHALPRRRDWTPVSDTAQDLGNASCVQGQNFSALLNNFRYDGHELEAIPVSADDTAKRRKLASKATRKPRAKAVKEPKVKIAKPPREPKVKKAKKKAQTITALATAPYQVADLLDAQITIPEILNVAAAPVATVSNEEQAVKLPRKRKATSTSDDTKLNRVRKAKVVKPDAVPRLLLPPTQAQTCLSDQRFIFGTSSQLHLDESPETLNQIQVALQASELSPQSPHTISPVRKSRKRVPTAPHGTCLNIGQADRDLWCVSARDHTGGILVSEHEEKSQVKGVPAGLEQSLDAVFDAADVVEHDLPCADHFLVTRGGSPADLPVNEEMIDSAHDVVLVPTILPDKESRTVDTIQQIPSDGFVMISDDYPVQHTAELDQSDLISTVHADRSLSHTQSQPPPPSGQRAVLQPLDINLSMKPQQLGVLKHLKGKPTSQPISDKNTTTQTKRRGRPLKATTSEADAANIITITSSSPTTLFQDKLPPHTSPSKILATLNPSPPSAWHNIDEISDSEASPVPFPPRKGASTSPIEAALELASQDEVLEDAMPIAVPNRAPRDNESAWSAILAKLFPQITSTIRATTRSDSLTKPTWHEKILLYDPIVIEDLTKWLNSEGLRVTVRRAKPKPRKKSVPQEYEDVEEELTHWMIQKWCEEHSICCLWKEGLRGGVRTRY